MARPGLQMLQTPDGWSVYYRSVQVVSLRHQMLAETYNYLFVQVDRQWQRYIVEFYDNCRLGHRQMVEMIVEALRSRGVYIEEWHYHADCYYVAEPDGVYLRNRHGSWFRTRKPVSEFSFESLAEGKDLRRGMSKLSLSLRHDYRNYLLMSGSLDGFHRHDGFSGRGFSIQNHSFYISSLHMANRPIIKLYDTTPRNSHLHGIVFVKFMRHRYAYAVVYCDCPPNVVVNRIRRSIETAFGLTFPKRHLQISLVLVKGEVSAQGDVVLRDVSGRVVARAPDGYYLKRSKIRDGLEFPVPALDSHYSLYPNIRKIIGWHMDRLVTVERQIVYHEAELFMDEDDELEVSNG